MFLKFCETFWIHQSFEWKQKYYFARLIFPFDILMNETEVTILAKSYFPAHGAEAKPRIP